MSVNRISLRIDRRRGIAILSAVVLALGVGSCGPGYIAPPVTPELVKVSPAPVSRIERGYSIHQTKCAKCHAFEDPHDYEVGELRDEIMPDMAKKSKLTEDDASAVLAYLLAAKKLPKPEEGTR